MGKIKYLGLAMAVFSMPFAAVSAPQQAPGVIDRGVPQVDIPDKFTLNKEISAPIKPAPEVDFADDVKIIANLSAVEFSGIVAGHEGDLDEISAGYLNRDITDADLAKLKYEVASYYYDQGFILVKAVTPPQDLKTGILKVDIYEAKIGNVTIESNNLLNPYIARNFIKRVDAGSVFNESDVESFVSDLNDLNGFGAVLNLQKGAEFGKTDLSVNLYSADEDVNYISADNYGSPLTGENVVTGYVEYSNLLNIGEQIYATARRSDGDLWSVAIGAQSPVGLWNLKINLNYLHSENEIADRLAFQQASGETDVISVGLSSDIFNTVKHRLNISAGFEARKHQTFSSFSGIKETIAEDDIRQAVFGANYLSRFDDAVYYADLKLRKGVDVLGADKGGVGRSDINGDPDAWRLQPTFLVNKIPSAIDGMFRLLAVGQLSSGELLSSDLFAIGGYGSVRGFDPAHETGESGYSFSLEYAHNMPDFGDWTVKLGPFFDGGAVYNRRNSAVDSHLYSAGLSLELEADIISSGTTILRADMARPIGDYNSTLVDDSQFFVRLTQNF